MTSAGRAAERGGFPNASASSIPAVTAEQMREVDRLAVEEFDLLLIQMMENAGIRLAELALQRFEPQAVAVLCGPGGNGGGGLVAARHLANHGVRVAVTLAVDRDRLGEVPRHQLAILARMGVPIGAGPIEAELVLDALIGYSLLGDPRARAAELIGWANDQDTPVCALDVPSGSRRRREMFAIRASERRRRSPWHCRRPVSPADLASWYLADISIPPDLYSGLGIRVGPLFASGSILRVT